MAFSGVTEKPPLDGARRLCGAERLRLPTSARKPDSQFAPKDGEKVWGLDRTRKPVFHNAPNCLVSVMVYGGASGLRRVAQSSVITAVACLTTRLPGRQALLAPERNQGRQGPLDPAAALR